VFALVAATWSISGHRVTAAEPIVDLELVLAVDVSGSVDDREYALQIGGIAAAFRDPAVQRAIGAGPNGRIAVSLVLWSDPQVGKAATPWRVIGTAAEAEGFARLVETQPRSIPAGSTGIGHALYACARLIQENGIAASRTVIDLSGDGEETAPRDYYVRLQQGRAIAAAAGITVNGLAILAETPGLESYYRREVITGPDAFVIAAADYDDFARAMRLKLLREIENRPQVSLRPQ
jgi:Protein of unknown function (DUF1194)